MKKKFPNVKKDLKMFLTSEEAKITKRDALRLGVGAMLALGMANAFLQKQASAQGSYIDNSVTPGRHVSHSSHGSHGSHASHGSHGSHGQW